MDSGKKWLTMLVYAMVMFIPTLSLAEVNSVYIESRLDFNAILISEVDIIFIYDEALLNQFPNTKSEWSSNKREIIAQAGDAMDLVSVFIPQGFSSEMASLPDRRDQAVKVFVIGQHDSSTRPPIDITDFENVLVEINEFGLIVSRRD